MSRFLEQTKLLSLSATREELITACRDLQRRFGLHGADGGAWDDLTSPASTVKIPAVGGPDFVQFRDNGAGSTGVFLPAFDKTNEESVHLDQQILHCVKRGSVIRPHVHWSPAAVTTGSVTWGIEYTLAPIDGAFPVTAIVYAEQAAGGDGYDHQLAPFANIDLSAYTGVSIMVLMRLFRDAAGAGGTDDLDDDAYLCEFDFHVLKDSIGSADYDEKDYPTPID